jgi:hypothetical protein
MRFAAGKRRKRRRVIEAANEVMIPLTEKNKFSKMKPPKRIGAGMEI